jgi:hypothetical protein
LKVLAEQNRLIEESPDKIVSASSFGSENQAMLAIGRPILAIDAAIRDIAVT